VTTKELISLEITFLGHPAVTFHVRYAKLKLLKRERAEASKAFHLCTVDDNVIKTSLMLIKLQHNCP
jgi:hypothetical protein